VDAREETSVAPRVAAVDPDAQDRALALELDEHGIVEVHRPERLQSSRITVFGSRDASTANQRSPSRTTRPAAASSAIHGAHDFDSSTVTKPIHSSAS